MLVLIIFIFFRMRAQLTRVYDFQIDSNLFASFSHILWIFVAYEQALALVLVLVERRIVRFATQVWLLGGSGELVVCFFFHFFFVVVVVVVGIGVIVAASAEALAAAIWQYGVGGSCSCSCICNLLQLLLRLFVAFIFSFVGVCGGGGGCGGFGSGGGGVGGNNFVGVGVVEIVVGDCGSVGVGCCCF